ncbi:hypothetical protein AB1N83_013401, partial [Pleurotus pulmonarius]
RCWRFS